MYPIHAILRNGLSYDEVYNLYARGYVSQKVWDRYWWFWTWSAARLSGVSGILQDRYHKKFGTEALYARFERTKKLAARVIANAYRG